MPSLQQSVKLLLILVLGSGTDKLVDQLATLKEEHGGNVTHAKLHGDVVVVFHVTVRS